MPDVPAFVRHPKNRIARESQYTDDIEGYVFDGAIPRGTRQSMEVSAGTRTMHVCGGKRAKRDGER